MASIDPLGWTVSLVGCSIDWLLTRNWTKILIGAIPTVLLTLLTITVWWGGRINEDTIAQKYEELGRAEIGDWESKLVEHFASNKQDKQTTDKQPSQQQTPDQPAGDQQPTSSGDTEQPAETDNQQAEEEGKRPEHMISQYGELLFRRIQLVRPTDESQFVVGTTLMQRGALAQGQKILRNIAPDDKVGLPKAHAIMAMSYLAQYSKTQDPELVQLLTHHSEAAISWEHTPKEVLYLAGDINWQKRNVDRALEIFQTAAERFPDLYPMLSQRYAEAKKPEESKAATESGINYLKGLLEKDPTDQRTRVMIAQQLGRTPEALVEAEELLRQAPEGSPQELVTRALSDNYILRFVNHLQTLKDRQSLDISSLEKAHEIDPLNPLIAEQTAILGRDGYKTSSKLQKSLKELLDSGKASTGTHAIMSEFYLAKKRYAEAIKHLEIVFKAAPMAVKYSNNLAYLYAQENRMDDALKTARTTLEILQRSGMQNAQHVDELLDTLGMIYRKMDRSTDSVSAYELALRFNPNRIDSRESLAALYRKLGNEGVAEAHEQAIEAIRKAEQEKAQQEQAGQSGADSNPSSESEPVAESQEPVSETPPEAAENPSSASPESTNESAPTQDATPSDAE